ncbi:MAG: MFS transporter [Actinomycetaceae bacterium]|nr:MFS transporter [Actinomycetaceae bacterium]
MSKLANFGFRSRQQVGSFLTVVFSGQVVYAAFESLKIPFYEPLRELLGLTNEQFGTMFTMLGLALFFYLPGGWVNNRLSVRTVLFWGLAWRVLTGLIMVIFLPPYPVLLVLALTWGILDGIYWPAVVKGVALFAGAGNKSFGFGILNGFRAGGEAILNGILIAAMALTHGSLLTFRTGMGIYACLGAVMMLLIWLYVPADQEAAKLSGDEVDAQDTRELDAKESLRGLWLVLRRLDMWIAGLTGLCVYWVYLAFVYVTPFLRDGFGLSPSLASAFSVAAAVLIGLTAGLVGGLLADKVFHSATIVLCISLVGSALVLLALRLLPGGEGNQLWAILGMTVFAFFALVAKTIQQAPVTELNLASNIMGSAMSVNSFFGFASILWALKLNGRILDQHPGEALVAFHQIFAIIAVVALVGATLALLLEIYKRRSLAR